jgi:phosphatidylserine decarboxylase
MSPAFREFLRIVLPMTLAWFVSVLLPFWWACLIGIPLGLLILFTAYFFRDPLRDVPEDPLAIVAAADGTVTAIDEVEEAPYNQGKRRRISVFLSVFNVHINRTPYEGTIRRIEHTPGQFLDVRIPKSALLNERQDWLLETTRGPLVVRQIAGLIARRIVAWSKVGDEVPKGFRFGMIRFGSRTEIFLPTECTVTVKVGDHVQGGSTIVARWPG